jgi:hypothetical protein
MAKAWTDPQLLETLVVFAVAQRAFDHPSESGAVNTFCTLQPLMLEDGGRARESQFPNNGLVWWKLRAPSREYAEPGRLLAGYIEPAVQYAPEDYNKQLYQAVAHEIAPVGLEDAVEVYSLGDGAIGRPRDLVNTPGVLELDHPPSDMVLVRWRGELYGLFRTSIAASGAGLFRVTLATASPDGAVLRMPDVPAGAPGVLRAEARISLDTRPPYRSSEVRTASYELLLPERVVEQQAAAFERLTLLKDDELIVRAAKRLLTRAERQRLAELLTRMHDDLLRQDDPSEAETAELIEAVRRRAAVGAGSMSELTRALLETDAMVEPLARALEQRAQAHVEENAAALAAEVEARIAGERERLEALRHEREDIEAQLEARRREAERAFGERMDEAMREHRTRVDADLARIAEERAGLEARASELAGRLTEIAGRFGSEHERLLGDLLLLLPVLQRMGPAAAPHGEQAGLGPLPSPAAEGGEARAAAVPVVLPAWVERGAHDPRGAPQEADFYARFAAHAAATTYGFSALELAAFHVALKSGDLTLLGGAAGTGRAALARLYAEALAGDAGGCDARFLSSPVQVTWLDVQDLLGAVNPHARLFEPASTGVFRFLVNAVSEYERNGADSGIHVLCLIEVDRASPEHYLSALLHALEGEADRRLRCFDPHAVRPDAPFAQWSTIALPPTIRIVGTLAEDESARTVGQGVRDRANELRLAGGGPRDSLPGGAAGAVGGAPVPMRAYQRWTRDAPLAAPWSGVLDRLRAPLGDAGIELSPRAQRMLTRFVASGGDVLPTAAAFDVQLAWRVLPRLGAAALLDGADAAAAGVTAMLEPHLDELPVTAAALGRLRARGDALGGY